MKVRIALHSSKITSEDFDLLRSLVLKVWKKHKRKHPGITWQKLIDGYSGLREVKDPEKRARWDLLWVIPRSERTPLIERIYEYANDTHIDTALKTIVKDLNN